MPVAQTAVYTSGDYLKEGSFNVDSLKRGAYWISMFFKIIRQYMGDKNHFGLLLKPNTNVHENRRDKDEF